MLKQKITCALAVIAFCSGLVKVFYFLNRKAKRIVTFHNVLPDEGFVWNPETSYSLPAACFRRAIRELKRHYGFSTDLADRGTVTLTFDDGNANQFQIAAKILQEEDAEPAILFIAGRDRIGRGPEEGLAVDKLCFWTAYVPEDVLARLNGGVTIGRAEFWCKLLRPRFAKDAATRGEATLKWLNVAYPFSKLFQLKTPEYLRLRFAGLSNDERNELRRRGWTIGWHTDSHYPLASLSEAEQMVEMSPPEEMAHVVFSYPYGELLSVNQDAIAMAERLGYPCAVANIEYAGSLHGRFFLPRFNLPALNSWTDKCLFHFKLSGLKYFMQYHKLLPRGLYGNNQTH